jgi:hypothetical protein
MEYFKEHTAEKCPEIHRYWETDSRYYSAHLVKDLFGEWILDKHWGGKYNRHRRWKAEYCSCYHDGLKKIEKLNKLRENHKYEAI